MLALWAVWTVTGAWSGEAAAVSRSISGQFIVYSRSPTTPTLGRVRPTGDAKLATLEPDPLLVSCERLKQALLRDLDMADTWRGKVHIRIQPSARNLEPIRVSSTRYADGWQYGLDLPEQVEPFALVRALVQVLLTEIANRTPGPHQPEIPVLLVEGLTGRIAATAGPDLVLQPNPVTARVGGTWAQLQPSSRSQRPVDAMLAMRAYLGAHAPLSFNELGLPTLDQLRGERLDTYRVSAQLFLGELLRLPNGHQMLQSMLQKLTSHLNWQTAFLEGFRNRFSRLIDVEKWWALVVVEFTAGDAAHAWPWDLSMARLEQVLTVHLETKPSAEAPPEASTIGLREVIAEWDAPLQRQVLEQKINLLAALEPRVAADLVLLVSSYRGLLRSYLEQRPRLALEAVRKGPSRVAFELFQRDTLRRLERLEQQRSLFQLQGPPPKPLPASAPPTPPGKP